MTGQLAMTNWREMLSRLLDYAPIGIIAMRPESVRLHDECSEREPAFDWSESAR